MVAHPAYQAVEKWATQFGRHGQDFNKYFFFDANGSELQDCRITTGCSIHHLTNVMSSIVKKKGKGISFSEYRKLAPDFKKAIKLLEVGWYSEAEDIFENISKKKFKPEPPMVKTSKEKLEEIKEIVDTRLKEIQKKIEEGKKKEALVDLYIFRGQCKQMKIQTEITKIIGTLEKDDSIDRDFIKQAKMEEKACEIFLKGEGYLAEGNTKSAKDYFERVEGVYKETSFFEKAKEKLEELDSK